MRVAVLALQGAFEEHRKMLSRLSVDSFEIRQVRSAISIKPLHMAMMPARPMRNVTASAELSVRALPKAGRLPFAQA